MADCSRNAVMNVTFAKSYIRTLACMGFNMLELYTEDTYEIAGEPYFGYMRGRFSAAELKELDAYGRMFGVELVPCIQTLAHLNAITRWPRYAPMIDCNDILLAGDDRTYELVDKMFATLAECFTSPPRQYRHGRGAYAGARPVSGRAPGSITASRSWPIT